MTNKPEKIDNELDLLELLAAVWSGKYFILTCTISAILYAFFITIKTDKLYTANAIFEISSANNNNLQISEEFGALAKIAGLGQSSSSSTDKLIERVMASEFILSASTTLSLESDKYFNPFTQRAPVNNWKTKLKKFIGLIGKSIDNEEVTKQNLIRNFRENVDLQETNAGALSLKITHLDPQLAAKYTNEIMFEIKNLVEKENEKAKNFRLSYLSVTLADALQEMEVSQQNLKNFALKNNLGAENSFVSETIRLDSIRMERSNALEFLQALEAIDEILINKTPLVEETYKKLRISYPLIDDVNFRRIVGMSESISAWTWPTLDIVNAVKTTLTDRVKRLDVEINETELEAQNYAKSAEERSKLVRATKIAEATYKVLIEQVKSQSLAAGFKPDFFKIFEMASPPLLPSKPNRNQNLFLGGLLGLSISSIIYLLFANIRGVYYTRHALIRKINSPHSLLIPRNLTRLSKRTFNTINEYVAKKPILVLDQLFTVLSNKKVIVLADSRSRIDVIGLAMAVAVRSTFAGNKVLLINFSKYSKRDVEAQHSAATTDNGKNYDSIYKTEFGVDIFAPNNKEINTYNFIISKAFDEKMATMLRTYDQIYFITSSIDSKLSLLKLTTYDATVVNLTSIKKTTKKDVNELIEIQPIGVLIHD